MNEDNVIYLKKESVEKLAQGVQFRIEVGDSHITEEQRNMYSLMCLMGTGLTYNEFKERKKHAEVWPYYKKLIQKHVEDFLFCTSDAEWAEDLIDHIDKYFEGA